MSPHDHNHDAAAEPGAQSAGSYTCPMHPDVNRAGPGKCPICGMKLVRQAAATGQKT